LLQYQGWSDQNIPPLNSVNYYKRVAATLGGVKAIDSNYRLFMVPGMAHCRGGEGTDQFDMLGTLGKWREAGQAPERILASRVDQSGAAERTRPLCPYPQVAVYSGTGSTNDAANFSCRAQ
jgi:feruloyl esterase